MSFYKLLISLDVPVNIFSIFDDDDSISSSSDSPDINHIDNTRNVQESVSFLNESDQCSSQLKE